MPATPLSPRSPRSPLPGTPGGWLRLVFGVREPVGRRVYLLVGVVLSAVKLGGDLLILHHFTGEWLEPFELLAVSAWPATEMAARLTLGAWALPFAWIGLSLTIRRLLDSGHAPWYAVAFCVPGVNLLVMAVLAVLPSRPADSAEPARRSSAMDWHHPSSLQAVSICLLVTAVAIAVAVVGLQALGLFLFAGTPLAVGFVSGFLGQRVGDLRHALWLGLACLVFSTGLLILTAVEGLICLVMVLPIAALVMPVGVVLGYAAADATRQRRQAALLLAAASLSLLAWVDADPSRPVRAVTTEARVAAPPEVVWRHVIAFTPLPPAKHWIFRAGVAYPVGARIEGTGVGAVRHCEFSTGAFVEPITAWEAPHRLAFDVAEQPLPLDEVTPYDALIIDHRDHGIHALRGEFRLRPDGAGGTVVEGTTWYQLQVSPQAYWGLWSDRIIHTIHRRVLDHVTAQAEADAARG